MRKNMENTKIINKMYIRIIRCSRCGKDHKDLLFKEFVNPVYTEERTYNYWGMCPENNEPILMVVTYDDK
jgi:hypothetical protein